MAAITENIGFRWLSFKQGFMEVIVRWWMIHLEGQQSQNLENSLLRDAQLIWLCGMRDSIGKVLREKHVAISGLQMPRDCPIDFVLCLSLVEHNIKSALS